MQTMQQKRARFALQAMCGENGLKDKDYSKEIKARASDFPCLIHMSGLGQAAAFYRSKGSRSEAYRDMYRLLSGWLSSQGGGGIYPEGVELLDGITQHPMSTYLAAEAEALAFLEWVKRFADAYIEGEPAQGGTV